MKTAIVFGSSGFVGSYLLSELLSSCEYEQVTIVVRKDLGIKHPKLKTLIGDYDSLPDMKANLSVDEIFIALGATKKTSPDKAAYYRADHDYPVLAARIAKETGARSIFLITAVGANPSSNVFYVKTKGETERDIIALDFEHTHIFRVSMITGDRQEKRSLEKLMIGIWSVIDPLLLGSADRYKGLTGSAIARAMVRSATRQSEKLRIYHWKEMKALLQR
jgi:uncharacterized protein YbjT (DUF2867 family)